MRTTLDLPEPLYRKLKAQAAVQGLTTGDLIAQLLARGLRRPPAGAPRPKRSRLPIIRKATTGKPIPALSAAEIAQLDLDEDLAKHGRSSGR